MRVMPIRALAVALTAAVGGAAVDTPFPERMFGVWSPAPKVTPQSILGPLSYSILNWPDEGPTSKGGFSAQRDPKTGDVWWTLLVGQVFHVSGDEMQYCFGELGMLIEQSPFSVDAVSDDNVTFCWRRGLRGMPTHTAGCSGCDCAKILITLTGADTLELTFWMSPPVVHVHLQLVRKKKEPSMRVIHSTMFTPYKTCDFVPHYGPNLPGEPDLRNKTALAWPEAAGFEVALEAAAEKKHYDDPKVAALAALPRGCARGLLRMAEENEQVNNLLKERAAAIEQAKAGDDDVTAPALGKRKCHQLNGFNHLMNKVQVIPAHRTVVPDVRLQYVKPAGKCNPCDVSYSISAAIDEDEYISVGFKGQSWEGKFPYPPEYGRPCYFGMCVDSYDNFTSDRIALGYASSSHGTCVREVEMRGSIVGKPKDAEYPMLRGMSAERAKGRTIVRFTVSQYWPASKGLMFDGPFRTMWAIGKLTGGSDCEADFGYHGLNKGVSPVDWLMILGSTPCEFSHAELPSGPVPPAPTPVRSYACVGGQCTPAAGGVPIDACAKTCADSYACLAGQCVEDPSGIPKQLCVANCGV